MDKGTEFCYKKLVTKKLKNTYGNVSYKIKIVLFQKGPVWQSREIVKDVYTVHCTGVMFLQTLELYFDRIPAKVNRIYEYITNSNSDLDKGPT